MPCIILYSQVYFEGTCDNKFVGIYRIAGNFRGTKYSWLDLQPRTFCPTKITLYIRYMQIHQQKLQTFYTLEVIIPAIINNVELVAKISMNI